MSKEPLSQSEIIRKNTSAISEIQRQAAEERTFQSRIADYITDFSGSMAFVYIHAIWFGTWILLNVGLIHLPYISEFDRFPFGLLTLIVSLEAIFLSTFVLISQNRLSQLSEQRAELDLHVDMLAEQKTAKILEMLHHITQQLNEITPAHFNIIPDPEIEALKVSPEPQEVLKVMKEAVQEKTKEVKEEVAKAVSNVTDEVETVREDVERVSGQVNEVATDVRDIKEEIKAR